VISRDILVREGLASDLEVRSCMTRHLPDPFTLRAPCLSDQRGRRRTGRVVAITTKAQRLAGGRAIADGKRAIVPDLRELMKLACGALRDLHLGVVLGLTVGGEIDVKMILGPWPSGSRLWCPAAHRPSSASTIGPGHQDEY